MTESNERKPSRMLDSVESHKRPSLFWEITKRAIQPWESALIIKLAFWLSNHKGVSARALKVGPHPPVPERRTRIPLIDPLNNTNACIFVRYQSVPDREKTVQSGPQACRITKNARDANKSNGCRHLDTKMKRGCLPLTTWKCDFNEEWRGSSGSFETSCFQCYNLFLCFTGWVSKYKLSQFISL